MNVIVNVLIQLLQGNYYYHYYCLTFYFILQNNSQITILTFMNVDVAFILAEYTFIFVDNSMQIFLRYISLRIWEDVCQKKMKNEQMMNKCFSVEFPCALDFEPWRRELMQRCLNTCNSCVF